MARIRTLIISLLLVFWAGGVLAQNVVTSDTFTRGGYPVGPGSGTNSTTIGTPTGGTLTANWLDVTPGNSFQITAANSLVATTTTGTYVALMRPYSEKFQDGGIAIHFTTPASVDYLALPGAWLRASVLTTVPTNTNVATITSGGYRFGSDGANHIYLTKCAANVGSYSAVTSPTYNWGTLSASTAYVVVYKAIGINPTTLTCAVYPQSGWTSVSSPGTAVASSGGSTTDSTGTGHVDGTSQPAIQQSGQTGILIYKSQTITSVEVFNSAATMVPDTATFTNATTRQTINLTGSATNWTNATVFSFVSPVSGGPVIYTQSVSDGQHAQLVIEAGYLSSGTPYTLQNSSDSATTGITIQDAGTHTYSNIFVQDSTRTPTGATLQVSPNKTQAGPYLWYKATPAQYLALTAGSAYPAGNLISGATSSTLVVTGQQPGSKMYYAAKVNGVAAANNAWFPYIAVPSTVKMGWLGDSITAGTGGTPVTGAATFWNATYAGNLLGAVGPWTLTNTNQGHAGAQTSDWLLADVSAYYTTARTAWNAAGCQYIHVMLGTNDAHNSVTPTTYYTNLKAIVDQLVTDGFAVIISYPPYSLGYSSNQLLQAYCAQIDALIAVEQAGYFNGGTGYPVMLGSDPYSATARNTELIGSDPHYGTLGNVQLGQWWANGIFKALTQPYVNGATTTTVKRRVQ